MQGPNGGERPKKKEKRPIPLPSQKRKKRSSERKKNLKRDRLKKEDPELPQRKDEGKALKKKTTTKGRKKEIDKKNLSGSSEEKGKLQVHPEDGEDLGSEEGKRGKYVLHQDQETGPEKGKTMSPGPWEGFREQVLLKEEKGGEEAPGKNAPVRASRMKMREKRYL